MIEDKLSPPSLMQRVDHKIRRVMSANLKKITPEVPQLDVSLKNSAAWFVHGDICTKVVFYNYFWRNHHEERVQLDLQLFDRNGAELWRDTQLVAQDCILTIDSNDIATAINLSGFEGYLTLSTNLKKVPNFIELIRFNVDYYSHTGGISTVHDQAIFWPVAKGEHSLGKMEVIDTPEIGTSLIFVNTQAYADTPVDVLVEVMRHDGQSVTIGNYSIKPKAMLRFELWKELPEIASFLEGKPGQVVAKSSYYIKRAAVLHHSKKKMSDWFSVNHSEEYRGHHPYLEKESLALSAQDKNGPMSPVPFLQDYHDVNTDLVLFHDIPKAGPNQSYGINLFDAQGNLLYGNEKVATVSLYGTERISLKDYLPADYSGYGLAQVFLSNSSHNERWQESFPMDAHYIVGESSWDAMYSQGSYQSINQPGDVKTRVFGRAYFGNRLKTQLALVYACSAPLTEKSAPDSATIVTLSDADGRFTYTRKLVLKPHQTVFLSIDEIFPEIKNLPRADDQVYGIYVRDVTAKILVIHFTKDVTRQFLATDHFYGG